MATPAISIVLPCFNAELTLPDAIESISKQTCRDWELIVFDDGSTDESRVIALACATKDGRITVLASKHVGIVEGLRRGCAEARGEFIARMDADDIAHPERLSKQLQHMLDHPETAISGTQVGAPYTSEAHGRGRYVAWVNGLITHEAIIRELFVECPLPHPTFMMRREAFDAVGGYQDHGWAEDYDLCMRFFAAGMRFGKVAEPLLVWRESPNRLSRVDSRYAPEQFRALKRHYLACTYFKQVADGIRTFHQWGAGEVGKVWLREWNNPMPKAVVDIHPRKIGRRIHGVSVIPPEALPPPGKAFTVVTVGALDARRDIRAWFAQHGYMELEDFLFLA